MKASEKETLSVTTSEQKAREIITEYMGESIHTLTISTIGRELFVHLFYIDFKPTREVQRHLEDMIPNITFDEIGRDYSTKWMNEGLELTDELFPEIYVKEADGCLRPASPLFLVLETLKHLDLTKDESEILQQVREASPKYKELRELQAQYAAAKDEE